ncbi:MAG: flavin reductase [Oscillibacter sp.]|nr:flavin reductase [Oscillibacter sp.]
MKKTVSLADYAGLIQTALPKGILLNTNGDKFNAMVIGWGNLGVTWGEPTFVAYVRENRYTKAQIDKTGEFTLSVPLNGPLSAVTKICGGASGRDIDKAAAVPLTLEAPEANHTPGVREYPLTLECEVLYAQRQEPERLPDSIRAAMYPQDVDGAYPRANRDPHTAYVARILRTYIIS